MTKKTERGERDDGRVMDLNSLATRNREQREIRFTKQLCVKLRSEKHLLWE